MKILTFSTLYPNAENPSHGIFVETRLRHILRTGQTEARVVAPIPWFPSQDSRWGRYARFAHAPRIEERHGIKIVHPRYVAIPKLGMSIAPFLLTAGAWPTVKNMLNEGYDFDIIDAHYFFPDGVAAAMIGHKLAKPVVITARGSDVNLLAQYVIPRRMIKWAADRAAALITVSAALKQALMQLKVDSSKITVLRNGVDVKLFYPMDWTSQRRRLGLTGTVLLMVGHLEGFKGHDIVFKALSHFTDARLVVIGQGIEETNLRNLAHTLGIEERVRFVGELPQKQLVEYYSAADALILASSREGWPNVLLEAMACGTPVISTSVGGTPEIVCAPEAGVLMKERTIDGVIEGLSRLLDSKPDRRLTRCYAERFTWEETAQGQISLLKSLLRDSSANGGSGYFQSISADRNL